MGPTIFHPVFLLVAGLRAVTALVEPPTNVTLHCRNLHNVVEWSYGEFVPGLKFKVFIATLDSPPREFWVDPPTLQADVSFLSDPNDDYYLTVTAVVGQNESEVGLPGGIRFSYFRDSLVPKKCFLDFPSVNVTSKENGSIIVRFMHPWLLYYSKLPQNMDDRRKRRHDEEIREPLPEFVYYVVVDNQVEKPLKFFCEESECETKKLPVDPVKDEHCVKVSGELHNILVQGTQEYCASALEEPRKRNGHTYMYITVTALVLAAFTFILLMVFWKKTKPSTSIPNSMKITSRMMQQTFGVVQDQVAVPDVGPASPTPLLSNAEEKEFTSTVTSPNEPDLRLSIGVLAEDEGVCDVAKEEEDEESPYRDGNLDVDEALFSDIPSGYEKRQVLVDLAPDEQAQGYRG